eukprot:12753591-Alexandrium_andersonii.AAC.1
MVSDDRCAIVEEADCTPPKYTRASSPRACVREGGESDQGGLALARAKSAVFSHAGCPLSPP